MRSDVFARLPSPLIGWLSAPNKAPELSPTFYRFLRVCLNGTHVSRVRGGAHLLKGWSLRSTRGGSEAMAAASAHG